jgi:hypothetical protein
MAPDADVRELDPIDEDLQELERIDEDLQGLECLRLLVNRIPPTEECVDHNAIGHTHRAVPRIGDGQEAGELA